MILYNLYNMNTCCLGEITIFCEHKHEESTWKNEHHLQDHLCFPLTLIKCFTFLCIYKNLYSCFIYSSIIYLFGIFKTEFLYVTALIVLELTLQNRLSSNSLRSACLYFLGTGTKGMCHDRLSETFTFINSPDTVPLLNIPFKI